MAVTRSHPVFAITFAVTYAILYVLAVEHNWALFTYHPVAEEFHFLVERAADGPSMYWYGWMATAGLGALFIAAIVARLPAGLTNRLAIGLSWAIPLATMGIFVYLMKDFFFR
jgi:hypothetical protein